MKERILNNKYKILTQIGKGGMSTVYLAMDLKLNRQWAVKEIHKDTIEYQSQVDKNTTLREIEFLNQLNHPGLPRIVDVIDTKESLFVVMDYVEGETLKKILQKKGTLSQEIVIKCGLQIIEILSYLHSQNPPVIYRDLKPSNIMLTPQGRIKIIDFGIAREYKNEFEDTTILGTTGFAPPEQFTGKTDTRSDIYSFGVTIYQLLTGQNMKRDPVIKKITDINSSLSTGLEAVILKCTRQNPEERYQSVEELKTAFRNYKKMDVDYLKMVHDKKKKFLTLLIAGGICFVIGFAGLISNAIINAHNYNELLNKQEVSIEKIEENIEKAISIKPSNKEGYLKLIDEYTKTKFDEDKASKFLAIYNTYADKLSKRDKAEIDFEIGMKFIECFEGNNDTSARNSLIYAKDFFISASESEDKEISSLSQNYVKLAKYQENYAVSSNILKNNDSIDIKEMVKDYENMIDLLKNYKGNETLKLYTYNMIFTSLSNEKTNMIVQNISYDTIKPLLVNLSNEVTNISENKGTTSLKKSLIKEIKSFEEEYQNVKKEEK